MNDQPQPNAAVEDRAPPPTAVVRSRIDRRWRLSLIWAVPVVTALIKAPHVILAVE